MATAAKKLYPHIVKQQGYCGGKAAIDDTRVRVNNVAWLALQGVAPEQIIADHHPDLTLAQVHAALAYFYDNRAEIEAELATELKASVEFDRERLDVLERRARR